MDFALGWIPIKEENLLSAVVDIQQILHFTLQIGHERMQFLYIHFCSWSFVICGLCTGTKNARPSFNVGQENHWSKVNYDASLHIYIWFILFEFHVSQMCIFVSWKLVCKLLADSYAEEKDWRFIEEIAKYIWTIDAIEGTKSFMTGNCLILSSCQRYTICSSKIHTSEYYYLPGYHCLALLLLDVLSKTCLPLWQMWLC